MRKSILLTAALLALSGTAGFAGDARMSFFITSVNPGEGGNLGGLAGADAHCTALAKAAGNDGKTWHAYLSTSTVNARDRIGSGPWYAPNGEEIAANPGALHGDNNITKSTALNENSEVVNGRGDKPNRHDIMTGSDLDGTLMGKACGDWTGTGSTMVGHHDRTGGGAHPKSWSSAHESRGCDMKALRSTGGDGLFYCFAID